MKLQGISDKGIGRIARVIKSQDLGEPDYGDSLNPEEVKRVLKQANAEWTSEGWVIEGGLDLSELNITRLPKIKLVNGYFLCYHNKLESLDGSPKEVGGDFYCSDNQLEFLDGAPREVGRDFGCSYNPGNFTEEDVREVCGVGGEVITG